MIQSVTSDFVMKLIQCHKLITASSSLTVEMDQPLIQSYSKSGKRSAWANLWDHGWAALCIPAYLSIASRMLNKSRKILIILILLNLKITYQWRTWKTKFSQLTWSSCSDWERTDWAQNRQFRLLAHLLISLIKT